MPPKSLSPLQAHRSSPGGMSPLLRPVARTSTTLLLESTRASRKPLPPIQAESPRVGPASHSPLTLTSSQLWRMIAFMEVVDLETLLDTNDTMKTELSIVAGERFAARLKTDLRHSDFGLWLPIARNQAEEEGMTDEHGGGPHVMEYLSLRYVSSDVNWRVRQLFHAAVPAGASRVWIPCRFSKALYSWLQQLFYPREETVCCVLAKVSTDDYSFGDSRSVHFHLVQGYESMPYVAAFIQHTDCLRWMHAAGVPLDARVAGWDHGGDLADALGRRGHTAAEIAAFHTRESALQFLLQNRDRTKDDAVARDLLFAAVAGIGSLVKETTLSQASAISILVDAGLNVAPHATDALHYALCVGGASDKHGRPEFVASRDRIECVIILLQHGANPNAVVDGSNTAGIAAAAGHLNVLKRLHQQCGVRLSDGVYQGMTALEAAAMFGGPDIVEFLVQPPDTWDFSPVLRHFLGEWDSTAAQAMLSTLAALISGGADASVVPIPSVVCVDAKLLTQALKVGMKPNAKTAAGRAALHTVLTSPDLGDAAASSLVSMLVEAGADVDLRDTAGDTPSHLAARRAYKSTLKCLQMLHADATLLNDAGETASQLLQRLHPSASETSILGAPVANNTQGRSPHRLRSTVSEARAADRATTGSTATTTKKRRGG